jgi:hypothetical protein
MKQRIAADQGDIASAGAVDVTCFAAGHEGLGSDYARCLTGAGEFSLGQLAQVVVPRLQRELAVGGINVGAELYPGGFPFGNRALSPRSAYHEIVQRLALRAARRRDL